MGEQLGLFGSRSSAHAPACPRFPSLGQACPQVRERRAACPGKEACEALGEQEAARLRLVHLAPQQLQAVAPRVDDSRAPVPEVVQPTPLAEACEHAYWQRERMWHDAGIPGAEEISVRPGDLTRRGGPETSAPTDTLVGGRGDQSTAGSAPDSALVPHGARSCGACGCTEAEHPITLYERGPFAGAFRCWPCAKPVLTMMEDGHG